MFQIETNIKEIIRQTDELIENRIPKALDDALAPELWYRDARDLAVRVILAIATPQERQFIPDFADTVTASVLSGGGLSLQMHTPFPELTDLLKQAQAARSAVKPGDLLSNLFLGQVQDFEAMLLKWVETEKHKDSRDAGKTDEDIAQLISYILLSPNLTPGGKGEQARAKLMPHIAEFLARQQTANRMAPETVDRWLRAVLPAWRELVRVKYAERVRACLRGGRGALL